MADQDRIENANIPEKLAQVEQLLEEYEQSIGLNKKDHHKEPDYIDRQTLLSMHPDDIDGLRWDYAQYSLYLQKQINKHQSRFYWADHNLKRYLEKISPEYPGWKWEERIANALADNEYSQKLDRLRMNSKLVIERTSFLTNKISTIDMIAKDISYAKRQQMRKENG